MSEDYSLWAIKKKFGVLNTYVDEELTDFPIFISFAGDASIATYARPDGYDFRFVLPDDTPLSYERTVFEVTGGTATAQFWVKFPTVYADHNTPFYVYYGKADATNGEDVAGTWSNGFQGVWHLDETTGPYVDVSPSGNSGTSNGTSVTQTDHTYPGYRYTNNLHPWRWQWTPTGGDPVLSAENGNYPPAASFTGVTITLVDAQVAGTLGYDVIYLLSSSVTGTLVAQGYYWGTSSWQNGKTFELGAGVTSTTGIAGVGQDISNSCITVGAKPSLLPGTDSFSISIWMKPKDDAVSVNGNNVMGIVDSNWVGHNVWGDYSIQASYSSYSGNEASLSYSGTDLIGVGARLGTLHAANWSHVCVVADRHLQRLCAYFNGMGPNVVESDLSDWGAFSGGGVGNFRFGSIEDSNKYSALPVNNLIIDEARYAAMVRSGAWVKLEYYNLISPELVVLNETDFVASGGMVVGGVASNTMPNMVVMHGGVAVNGIALVGAGTLLSMEGGVVLDGSSPDYYIPPPPIVDGLPVINPPPLQDEGNVTDNLVILDEIYPASTVQAVLDKTEEGGLHWTEVVKATFRALNGLQTLTVARLGSVCVLDIYQTTSVPPIRTRLVFSQNSRIDPNVEDLWATIDSYIRNPVTKLMEVMAVVGNLSTCIPTPTPGNNFYLYRDTTSPGVHRWTINDFDLLNPSMWYVLDSSDTPPLGGYVPAGEYTGTATVAFVSTDAYVVTGSLNPDATGTYVFHSLYSDGVKAYQIDPIISGGATLGGSAQITNSGRAILALKPASYSGDPDGEIVSVSFGDSSHYDPDPLITTIKRGLTLCGGGVSYYNEYVYWTVQSSIIYGTPCGVMRGPITDNSQELFIDESPCSMSQQPQCGGVAVDGLHEKIYWSVVTHQDGEPWDTGFTSVLKWADLDGSNRDTLITTTDKRMASLRIDSVNEKIYWSSESAIKRASLNGTMVETLYTVESGAMIGGIDLWGDYIYFTTFPGIFVRRININGGGLTNIYEAGSGLRNWSHLSGLCINASSEEIYTGEPGWIISDPSSPATHDIVTISVYPSEHGGELINWYQYWATWFCDFFSFATKLPTFNNTYNETMTGGVLADGLADPTGTVYVTFYGWFTNPGTPACECPCGNLNVTWELRYEGTTFFNGRDWDVYHCDVGVCGYTDLYVFYNWDEQWVKLRLGGDSVCGYVRLLESDTLPVPWWSGQSWLATLYAFGPSDPCFIGDTQTLLHFVPINRYEEEMSGGVVLDSWPGYTTTKTWTWASTEEGWVRYDPEFYALVEQVGGYLGLSNNTTWHIDGWGTNAKLSGTWASIFGVPSESVVTSIRLVSLESACNRYTLTNSGQLSINADFYVGATSLSLANGRVAYGTGEGWVSHTTRGTQIVPAEYQAATQSIEFRFRVFTYNLIHDTSGDFRVGFDNFAVEITYH